MSEWQPIETAPKDGTRILLYIPVYECDKVRTGVWCGYWIDSSGVDSSPTHWMPLPEPPK